MKCTQIYLDEKLHSEMKKQVALECASGNITTNQTFIINAIKEKIKKNKKG